jgi:hypothetical protein
MVSMDPALLDLLMGGILCSARWLGVDGGLFRTDLDDHHDLPTTSEPQPSLYLGKHGLVSVEQLSHGGS